MKSGTMDPIANAGSFEGIIGAAESGLETVQYRCFCPKISQANKRRDTNNETDLGLRDISSSERAHSCVCGQCLSPVYFVKSDVSWRIYVSFSI